MPVGMAENNKNLTLERTMKTVCAWCRQVMDTDHSGSPQDDDAPISHGVCPQCIPKFFSFMGKPMQDYLDGFAGPVFLVDSTRKIITANTEGLALIDKKPDEIEKKMAGNVFECPHASRAEGCGNSIHCKSCTIRNAINDTLATGKACHRLPAYADLHTFAKNRMTNFSISTEKVGDAVLLRIDDLTSPPNETQSHNSA